MRSPNCGKVRRPQPPRVLFVVDQYPFALPDGESVVVFVLRQPGRATRSRSRPATKATPSASSTC